MRSSLVFRASDCQCRSCNGPGFDPSIRRHSGIWGAADEAVLNIVRTYKINKLSWLAFFRKSAKCPYEILSVSDPHWFQSGSGAGSISGSGSRSRFLMTKNWMDKIYKKINWYFWIKNLNFLIIILRRTSSYRRSLQPSEENIQHFKTRIFPLSVFCGSFLPSCIRIRILPTKINEDPWGSPIRIRNTSNTCLITRRNQVFLKGLG